MSLHINPSHYLYNSSETGPSVGPLPGTLFLTALNNRCINLGATWKLKNNFKAEVSNGVFVPRFLRGNECLLLKNGIR